MLTYTCVFLGSAAAALATTPLMIRLGHRLRILDMPGPRRVHTKATPRLGGVAIAAPVLTTIAVVYAVGTGVSSEFRDLPTQVLAVVGAAAFMLLVGLVDDVRGLGARYKLYAQILASSAVCASGVLIEGLAVKGLFEVDFGWLSWPVTMFWIVGMTNAVNLIDGLDGLASGIAAIACGVVAVLALHTGQAIMAVLMLSCLGTLIGFLVFNFNPARIFLGDSGTYFIGFLLGAGSALTATKAEVIVGLALPMIVMGVPIFDTLFALLRRFLERRPLFAPDRGHIHHLLMAMGLRPRQVVLALYALTVAAGGLGLIMLHLRDVPALALSATLLLLMAVAFRLAGAVSLRRTVRGLRQKHRRAKEVHQEHETLSQLETMFREVKTFQGWWQNLCTAADRLEFAALLVVVRNRDGTERRLEWRRSEEPLADEEHSSITVPIPDRRAGPPLKAEAYMHVNGSLENAGRHMALFSRLIESYGLGRALGNGNGHCERVGTDVL
jgi:UDP-GlcNAc:undecaprenyl-phosphate GlcNAc-1-phosphate transferase